MNANTAYTDLPTIVSSLCYIAEPAAVEEGGRDLCSGPAGGRSSPGRAAPATAASRPSRTAWRPGRPGSRSPSTALSQVQPGLEELARRTIHTGNFLMYVVQVQHGSWRGVVNHCSDNSNSRHRRTPHLPPLLQPSPSQGKVSSISSVVCLPPNQPHNQP